MPPRHWITPKPAITLYQLERFRGQEPPEVTDTSVFDDTHWLGKPDIDIEKDLARLRDPMTTQAQAAVFIGEDHGLQWWKPRYL